MKNVYVQALLELLESETDTKKVLDGFAKTLEARGHKRLLLPVYSSVLRVLGSKRPNTTLVVAREKDAEMHAAAIKQHLSALSAEAGDDLVTKIDETIIGGYIIDHQESRVDASHKQALLNLYRSITT